MYSIRKRVSKLMTFTFNFTTGLLVLIFLLTSFYNPELPKVKVQLNNVRGPPFIFDLDTNLTNQFHLNVKQIFLYMKINYDNENNDIIWSEIIKRSSKKVISKRVANNYVVAAPRSQKILYELRGCIFPFVGKIKDVLFYKEEKEYFPQIGSLLSLCSACIFFLNGVAILNNQRFLRRIGLPLDPEARKNLSPTKAKLVDLIKLTKGIATIPLIFLNLILIFYESFFGSN